MPPKKTTKNAPANRSTASKKQANNTNYGNYFYRNYKKPYKYPGLGRTIGSNLGSAIAGFTGNPELMPLGNVMGGAIGQGAHALVKTITGHGDYSITANSLIYNKDAVPKFSASNPRCTILTHSEFVRDIKGSQTFQNDSFDINAGNAALFPWLSQIARNFEQVVWQGLVFQFKTTCGSAVSSTNNSMGTVIMATQYNSLDAPFVNKQQMENYEFAQSCVPSASLLHAIECDPKLTANQGLFYIENPSSSDVNADPRLYNIGRFNIATQGMQANNIVLGELWVTYKVCLLKPKLTSNSSQSDQWLLDTTTAGFGTLGFVYGVSPTLTDSSTSSQYVDIDNPIVDRSDQMFTCLMQSPWDGSADDETIYINPSFTGQIIVVYQIRGKTPLPTVEPGFNLIGNISCVSLPGSNVGFETYAITGSTPVVSNADDMHWVAIFQVNGGYNINNLGPAIQLSGYSVAGATSGNLMIATLPGNLRRP